MIFPNLLELLNYFKFCNFCKKDKILQFVGGPDDLIYVAPIENKYILEGNKLSVNFKLLSRGPNKHSVIFKVDCENPNNFSFDFDLLVPSNKRKALLNEFYFHVFAVCENCGCSANSNDIVLCEYKNDIRFYLAQESLYLTDADNDYRIEFWGFNSFDLDVFDKIDVKKHSFIKTHIKYGDLDRSSKEAALNQIKLIMAYS